MSSRPVGLFLLLSLMTASGLAAQQPAGDELGNLKRKADSLARLWEEADALANLADSLAHAALPRQLDTIRVEKLVIVANPSRLPLKEAAGIAWGMIDSLYGSMADTLLHRPYLIHAIDPDSQPTRSTWGTVLAWDLTARETGNILAMMAPMPAPDESLRRWLGGPLPPAVQGLKEELGQSYVAVVTSPFGVARDCFTGSLTQCRSLLALDRPLDPARIYRTLSERQKAVRRVGFGRNENELRAATMPCYNGDDSTCASLLRRSEAWRLPPAVDLVARRTLVLVALTLGGRGAYGRLMADSTLPIDVRVANAAGVPLDSVFAVWHGAVVASRPVPVELPGYGPLVGLSWTVAFGLLAMRSSRWRVA